jgi:hypothetical protein
MKKHLFWNRTEKSLSTSMPLSSEGNFITPFLTYTGAFLLSIILIILIHEVGHFLALRWRGYDSISIRINPFMGTTSCQQDIQERDFIFIVLGGPIFDLSIATLLAIALRFTKSPNWIPVKMYSAMAFLIEGMVIIAGLFFQETITDFAWLISLGLTPIFVGCLGIFLIGFGGLLSYEIWILVGITPESSRKQLILLNGPFFLYGLLGVSMGMAILPIEANFVRKFLAVGMVLHWLYLGIRIILASSIVPRIRERMPGDIPKVAINTSKFSLILGCASWVLSFLVLN